MEKAEARELLDQELAKLRQQPRDELLRLFDAPRTFEATAPSGIKYQRNGVVSMPERPNRGWCLCAAGVTREGMEAEDYATVHLDKVSDDPMMWVSVYRCPVTGELWVKDHPHGELHGGGPSRLRTVREVAEVAKIELQALATAITEDEDRNRVLDVAALLDATIPEPPVR